eukprot:537808-Rhodomonas_salina.3
MEVQFADSSPPRKNSVDPTGHPETSRLRRYSMSMALAATREARLFVTPLPSSLDIWLCPDLVDPRSPGAEI